MIYKSLPNKNIISSKPRKSSNVELNSLFLDTIYQGKLSLNFRWKHLKFKRCRRIVA